MKKTIALIGVPGSGKSTCGVLAAKALCKAFIDTDLLIQQREGAALQDIIHQKGTAYFRAAEEACLCAVQEGNAVIATGGSAVYSAKAMEHLKEIGTVIYLKVSMEQMRAHIHNITTRGIVLGENESLEQMYRNREPLYEKYADVVIDCEARGVEAVVEAICNSNLAH